MFDWLTLQAQNASPFIAVFCLAMLAIAARVIKLLWQRHLDDTATILAVSNASIQANNAMAAAIERSTALTVQAIERSKGRTK